MKHSIICILLTTMMILSACGNTGSKTPEKPSESEQQTVAAESESAPDETQSGGAQSEASLGNGQQADAPGTVAPSDLAKLYDRIKECGAFAGVCYIGYNDSELQSPVEQQLSSPELHRTYPFIAGIAKDHWVLEPGEDIYCIVPGENVKKVVVYEYNVMDENPKKDKVLYESDTCDPFILTANVSDIATNTLIELDTADGHLEYAPCISLKDGGVYVPDGVIDFSRGANVMTVTQGEPVHIDDKELVLYINEPDEAGNGPLMLAYDGQVLDVEEFAEYMPNGYILKKKSDDFYVFAVAGFSNDWVQTHLIHYTKGGGLKVCGMVDGEIDNLADLSEDQVVICSRADVFGTYGTYQNYKIQDDELVLLDDYQDFRNEPDELMAGYYKEAESDEDYVRQVYDEKGYRVLKVRKGFSAKAADGSQIVIPAGSVICPQGNKPGKQIFCFTYQGQNLEVTYSREQDSYNLTIDGVSQEEIFEMLPYAG